MRENKAALLEFLAASMEFQVPDRYPSAEFDGADGTTRQSLTIGLRSITHPLVSQALARLKGNP